MADPLYFSIWIKDLRQQNMMQHFASLLELFPISSLRPGVEAITVRAIDDTEPELLDEVFEEPAPLQQAIHQASQFLHEDCAYEITTHWDLWRKLDGDWRLLPQQALLCCFGPSYDNDMGDHLRFALGWDDQFLPDQADPASIVPVSSNLRSVARLAASMDGSLAVERRLLWSSGEESFLAQLEASVPGLAAGRGNA